jgi:hypothetical protein
MTCWSGSFPCRVYIDLSHLDTLNMSDNLSLQSSRSMVGVLLMDSRSWIWIWSELYYHYDYCVYLPLTLTWVNILLVYACSSLLVQRYYLAKIKMAKIIKAKDQLLVVDYFVPPNP